MLCYGITGVEYFVTAWECYTKHKNDQKSDEVNSNTSFLIPWFSSNNIVKEMFLVECPHFLIHGVVEIKVVVAYAVDLCRKDHGLKRGF